MPSRPWSAIVPVRAGSKGLPGKNMRLLCGKPLYRHAVDQALAAGASRVIITTDIPDICAMELPAGVEVLPRTPELASDQTPMAPVLLDCLNKADVVGTVVLLQATSPMRRPEHIKAALKVFERGDFDLVMSVTEADRGVLKWGRLDGERFVPLADPAFCFANRQNLPSVVKPNGAVYVMNAAWFETNGSFVTSRIGVVAMTAADSQDIDTLEDFQRCETALCEL
jgi:CMP-N-acetylneuraminic acid synthetase